MQRVLGPRDCPLLLVCATLGLLGPLGCGSDGGSGASGGIGGSGGSGGTIVSGSAGQSGNRLDGSPDVQNGTGSSGSSGSGGASDSGSLGLDRDGPVDSGALADTSTGSGGATGFGGQVSFGVGGTGVGGTGVGGTGVGGTGVGGTGAGGTGVGGTGVGGTGVGGTGVGGSGVGGSGGIGAGGTTSDASASDASNGVGGQAGDGEAGTGAFVAYTCPSGLTAPGAGAFPSGSAAARISGAPPSDSFNNNGASTTNVEGPVWIGDALYFSEMSMSGANPPLTRILKADSADAVTRFYPPALGTGDSGSNGMAVDPSGNLITANHGVGGIVRYTVPGGAPTTLIDSYNGHRFNSPNDLTLRNDGTIYFTDPTWQAPSPKPQSTMGVYVVPPGSSTATEVLSSLNNPNGITLSLDQTTLYVGHGGGVYSYSVNTDGTLGATATHVDPTNLDGQPVDGMAIDCTGNLYVVRINQHDIDVVSFGGNPGSAGTHLVTLSGIPGGGQLTNLAFGGTDHRTLYVTVMGSGTTRGVYKLTGMPVPGMPY